MSISRSHAAEQAACHAEYDVKTSDRSAGNRCQGSMSYLRWPLALGLLGALGLTAVYLGIVVLAESWAHALNLFREDALFVVPIVLGFGIQIALFTHLKRGRRSISGARAAGAFTGTSGSTSTLGMIACCAHHLTDVLPLVGLSGAAIFLAQYKPLLMIVGLLSNVVGIIVLSFTIRKAKKMMSSEGACH